VHTCEKPDENDYKKLSQVIRYLRGTISIPITMEAANLNIVKWWVDASFAVHHDRKGQTRQTLSLGKRVVVGIPKITR
jgi:hypothetical protein